MNRTKNIKIQVWADSNYVRTIGIWYPDIADTSSMTDAPPEQSFEPEIIEPEINLSAPSEVIIPQEEGSPFLIVTCSSYEPRREVMGGNPIAEGQSPMPKEFLESLIRNMSYMFANETSMFQMKTKALSDTFLAKQTFSYTMLKEVPMTVTPVQGSMSLKELGDYINQFSIEEQKTIKVINNVEKPITTDGKHIDEFIFGDKSDNQQMYITVTKLHDIYETEDPYIKMTSLPEDPLSTLAPGTEDAPTSKDIAKTTVAAIDADTVEREALETFDNMTEGTAEETEVSRIEVLEQLLVDKNQQLIDAGIIAPTIPLNPLEDMPEPLTQAEEFSAEVVIDVPNEEPTQSEDDLAYEAMTRPPSDTDAPQ